MMKKIVAIAALALSSTAVSADELGAQLRWGQDSVQQAFTYEHAFKSAVGQVNVGGEVETTQANGDGAIVNYYSANAGLPVKLADVLVVEPFAQYGVATISNAKDTQFYGVGAKAELRVYGPISVGAQYRYRDNVNGESFVDQRATGVVKVTLTDALAVEGVFHNHFGDWNDKQYGLGVSYRF